MTLARKKRRVSLLSGTKESSELVIQDLAKVATGSIVGTLRSLTRLALLVGMVPEAGADTIPRDEAKPAGSPPNGNEPTRNQQTNHEDEHYPNQQSNRTNTSTKTNRKKEGSYRLVGVSFRMLANTVGVMADGLRITGDTTAGVLGSSVKVIGVAVREAGGGVERISRWIAPKTTDRKPLTTSRLFSKTKASQHDKHTHPVQSGRVALARGVR